MFNCHCFVVTVVILWFLNANVTVNSLLLLLHYIPFFLADKMVQ